MMDGRGAYTWKARNVSYSGDFSRNALRGSGKYVWGAPAETRTRTRPGHAPLRCCLPSPRRAGG